MEDKSPPDESEKKNNEENSEIKDEDISNNDINEPDKPVCNAEDEVVTQNVAEPKSDPVDPSISQPEQETVAGANSAPENLATESQPQADSETEVKGWLQKRTKGLLGMSCKWERQWFQLKGTDLFYGENQQAPSKKIPLAGAEITESDIDNKTFAFGIKPKDSKRTYYIHADNEEDQQNWMQAICMAKLNKSGEGGACSLQ